MKKKKELVKAKKNFKELAEKLPLIQESYIIGERLLGSVLMKEDKDSKDGEGKPIDENKWYSRKITKVRYMNHFHNLVREYKNSGDIGVAKYLMRVGQIVEENKKREALQEKQHQDMLESAILEVPNEINSQDFGEMSVIPDILQIPHL